MRKLLRKKDCEMKASEFIEKHSLSYTAKCLGERVEDDWVHDEWTIEIKYHLKGRDLTISYKTGIGLRRKNRVFPDQPGRPVAPTFASVLESLSLECRDATMLFLEFCENLGYDKDSRKALDTYLSVQENTYNLQRLFGGEAYNEFLNIEE